MLPTSATLFWGFAVLAVALVTLVVAGMWIAGRRLGTPPTDNRRATAVVALTGAAWLAITWMIAASAVLRDFDRRPPPFLLFVAVTAAITVGIALSPVGTRLVRGLSLTALVGSQVFRFPLELLMDRAYHEGVMPVQMSFEGQNLDVLSGISAAVVAALLFVRRIPRWAVLAWNVVAFALLVNIVVVAILSTPLVAYFGRDRLNVWVTYPPFVWLPEVMVMAALLGHVLIFRKLRTAASVAAA